MAVAYEAWFQKVHAAKRVHHHFRDGVLLLLLLANITAWGVYAFHWTTFWSSTLALAVASMTLFYFRKDLVVNGIITGVLATMMSALFYATILLLNADWISATYLSGLSGRGIYGVPVEEFVFWFLAGVFFGPFYDFYQGLRTVKVKSKG